MFRQDSQSVLCVQNRLFEKKTKIEKPNNRDSTPTKQKHYFTNDYEAAKTRTFKYTSLEYV